MEAKGKEVFTCMLQDSKVRSLETPRAFLTSGLFLRTSQGRVSAATYRRKGGDKHVGFDPLHLLVAKGTIISISVTLLANIY